MGAQPSKACRERVLPICAADFFLSTSQGVVLVLKKMLQQRRAIFCSRACAKKHPGMLGTCTRVCAVRAGGAAIAGRDEWAWHVELDAGDGCLDSFRRKAAKCTGGHKHEAVSLVLPEEKSVQPYRTLPNLMTFREFLTKLWNVVRNQSRFNVCGA